MADDSSQDRDIPATPRKLQKAREKGQVARSRDFGHLAVLGGGALLMFLAAPLIYDAMRTMLMHALSFDAARLRSPEGVIDQMRSVSMVGILVALGVATAMAIVSAAAQVYSGGWVMSTTPITPDISRLNPLKGIKGMFTLKKLADVLKTSLLMVLILTLAGTFIYLTLPWVASWVTQPSGAIAAMFNWLMKGVGLLLTVVLLMAMIDLPLQVFLYKRGLKMTKQEVKDEYKQIEGNPQIKGKLRQRQRELAQSRSTSKVPQADFVLMNPTHYAVALKYDEDTMDAPRVISKGADLLALKIRDIAKANNVPVLQSPALARALYAHAELDRDIPAALFTAVAQVLAYVYRLKAALQGRGQMPGEMPQPVVPPGMDPHDKANYVRGRAGSAAGSPIDRVSTSAA